MITGGNKDDPVVVRIVEIEDCYFCRTLSAN
jgi:hypothetical protein